MTTDELILPQFMEALDGIAALFDTEGLVLETNSTFCEALGVPKEQLIGSNPTHLFPKELAQLRLAKLRKVVETRKQERWQDVRNERTFLNVLTPTFSQEGRVSGAALYAIDVTEAQKRHDKERRLATELEKARKMEALGRMASGVAHDFNNVLSGIVATCELLLENCSADMELRPNVEAMLTVARRSGALIGQLLSFASEQETKPQELELTDAVDVAVQILERLVGRDIELLIEHGPGPRRVRMDPHQVDQLLLNLAINARDAMPDGGTLRISTESKLDSGLAIIEVADQGSGIPEHIFDNIFDPFFTTKEEGTGLGLSSVHGIVHQNGGHISVETSEQGSIFRIALPLCPTGQ